jgi:ATP-dependent DNA ligase
MSILKLLEQIGSDTKRSHKTQLIEKNKNNALFLSVIKQALDPYINYHVRKIPPYKAKGTKSLEWAITELGKLSNRELTGHAAISHLANILSNVSTDDAIVIERIIGKDLRCGMADGTVNEVIPGFVPTYPCLLARAYDAKNIKNIVFPAYSQLKADGLRVNVRVKDGEVSICGRSGRPIDLLGAMDNEFADLGKFLYKQGAVIDGELVVVDASGKLLSRKVGNGIINKAIKGTISEEEARMVRAQIWDVIPLDEFLGYPGMTSHPKPFGYGDRYQVLKEAIDSVNKARDSADDLVATIKHGSSKKYWIIETKLVHNMDEAVEHFQEMLARGEEGTILKNTGSEAIWGDTRSKHLVKFKAEKECDLEVVGFNPGKGKFVGMVGSIQMTSADRKVEVNISGMSDELRKEITENFDKEWMGSICAVMYNERISSKDRNRAGIDSLFLPRLIEKRSDKTVADSSKDIK